MHTYERNGVVVDQCTECRGLFLDRGELERLVAAESSWRGGEPMPVKERYGERERYRPRHDDDDDHHSYHRPKKKRRSFLEDLFDD